ncbi:MAG: hypothetical protein ACXWUK_17740, partial [Burkholderiales bacterium]
SFFLLQPIKALLMFVLGFLPRLLFAIELLLAQMLLALPGFLLLPAATVQGGLATIAARYRPVFADSTLRLASR